jgi:flagellar motor switch protein FliG
VVLSLLEEMDPELTDEIKTSMFTFEDILSLSDTDMAKVVREVDTKDLALALRGASEELRAKFYKGMSTRAAAQLREDIEIMGPQRVTLVEEAQAKIVSAVRRLEQADEIVVARAGGEELR